MAKNDYELIEKLQNLPAKQLMELTAPAPMEHPSSPKRKIELEWTPVVESELKHGKIVRKIKICYLQ